MPPLRRCVGSVGESTEVPVHAIEWLVIQPIRLAFHVLSSRTPTTNLAPMIRTSTLLSALALHLASFAATGGPDGYGYTWIDSNEPDGPVFNWIDISTTGQTVMGLADDNVVGPFVMETDMPFYWYGRKLLWIGSNGYIAFNGQGNLASPFPTIPLAGGVNDYIAGLTADLNFTGVGNNARCYLLDNVDQTIISYVGVPFWTAIAPNYTGSNTFQIILNKLDSSITVQILEQVGITQNNDLLIGIESVAGSIGLQHSAETYPAINYAIRFEMPEVALLEVNDGAANWITAPGSGGILRSRNGSPVPLVANALNTGNVDLSGLVIEGAVLNSAGTVLNTYSQSVTNILAGGDTTVVFANALDPTTAGTFRFRNTVSNVPNDLAVDNNIRIQEVVVVDTTTATQDLRFHGTGDDGVGLSWNGGNGGVAVYIRPPYYPAHAIATTTRIVSNIGGSGFTMKVYADDGLNFGPGTLLDSVQVASADATIGDKVIPLSAPLTITTGGVYVQWYMLGENVNIAVDITPPFSNRTFEVLDGTWAPYRDAENTDFHLGLRLEQAPDLDVSCYGFFGLADGQTIASPTAVRIWLRNEGNQPVSGFPIGFQHGSAPPVIQTFTGTLAVGEQELVTFNTAFTPALDGTDALCAWAALPDDTDGTNDTTCVELVSWVGIDELAYTGLQVWPNPVSDKLGFVGLGPGIHQVLLLDAIGRTVLNANVTGQGTDPGLSVQGLANGTYHALISGPDRRYRATVVVHH